MKIELELPERREKPRDNGITAVIDTGLPTAYFIDGVSSYGHLIDLVKFGWATAMVTKDFDAKIGVLRDHGIKFCFGGTMFEKFVSQDRVDNFFELCRNYKMPLIEISNGTISMTNTAKANYIRKYADEFEIISEVGSKDEELSDGFTSAQWIEYIEEDLGAGATKVITEARESGKAGIFQSSGEVRDDIVSDILASNIDVDKVVFEAPNKTAQTYFINRLGANVNLGNIALSEVIGLETLRLGLRSDTLELFAPGASQHGQGN